MGTVKRGKGSGRGGWRPGAGRPKGSGLKPRRELQRNRVVVMLTDAEKAKLARAAKQRGERIGTFAHQLLARALARLR